MNDDGNVYFLIVICVTLLCLFGMLISHSIKIEEQKTIQILAENDCTRAEILGENPKK